MSVPTISSNKNTKDLKSWGHFIAKTISRVVNLDDTLMQCYQEEAAKDLYMPHETKIMNEIFPLFKCYHPPF
ncbi:hypothetical protein M408DRAFT_29411 [Serendipita vermifera MAFF 305830]|uniref:Uncharacterized protein n=1 Tax=Serendipita vermifera MAFF 305830 TaxID=933852 RepID=A0A0C3AAH3_SERVB|nr:hypothetical protein M408DRAFT_29411 [Serendipita vermifera MAFF 305830]